MPSHILEQTIVTTIERHKMLESHDHVIVAVSGGPDSVALLHALWRLRKHWTIDLTIAHLNHRLRDQDSDDDAAFVEALAASLDLPCRIDAQDVQAYCKTHRLSIETGARQLRYAFLERVANEIGAEKIATGHIAEDQAETILMRLLRGSGPGGTAGIRPIRDEKIIRPMLDVSRHDVMAYLEAYDLSFRIDKSNEQLHHLRNQIRKNLIPSLQKDYNPEVVQALCRFGEVLRTESAYLDLETERTFHTMAESSAGHTQLALKQWPGLPLAIQRRLIRRVLKAVGGHPESVAFDHIERVRGLIECGVCGRLLELPDDMMAERRRKSVLFIKGPSEAFEVPVTLPGITILPGTGHRVETRVFAHTDTVVKPDNFCALFDADRIQQPLTIRSRRPGDCFAPTGMTGTKSLKALFNERQIPRLERARVPLLVSEPHILWVIGHRLSRSGGVHADTKNVLMVKYSTNGDK